MIILIIVVLDSVMQCSISIHRLERDTDFMHWNKNKNVYSKNDAMQYIYIYNMRLNLVIVRQAAVAASTTLWCQIDSNACLEMTYIHVRNRKENAISHIELVGDIVYRKLVLRWKWYHIAVSIANSCINLVHFYVYRVVYVCVNTSLFMIDIWRNIQPCIRQLQNAHFQEW